MTTIHAEQDARRMQSITCAGLERDALITRLATMEAEAKQAREDEEWALRERVEIGNGGDVWGVMYEMRSGRQIIADGATIHAALRALRAKVEGGTK